MVDFLQMLADGSRVKTEGIREGASLGQQERYFYPTIGDKGSLLSLVSMVDRFFKRASIIFGTKKQTKIIPPKYEKMKRKNNKCLSIYECYYIK